MKCIYAVSQSMLDFVNFLPFPDPGDPFDLFKINFVGLVFGFARMSKEILQVRYLSQT